MPQQIFVAFATTDFTEKIELAQVSRERRIQTASNYFGVPRKWQIRWRITKIRRMRRQRVHETLNICVDARIDKIDIVGQAGRPMDDSSDTTIYQHWEEFFKLRAHRSLIS